MYDKLIFNLSSEGRRGHYLPECDVPQNHIKRLIDNKYLRKKEARLPEVAENEVIRHFIHLSSLNHHVDKSIYPLGSCTMKYNPKISERLAALALFSEIHPEQDIHTVQGILQIMYELQEYLKEITGFSKVSLQPAAGAQGELLGLLMIQAYHKKRGEKRDIILIPDSAHGTNPASAAIAGFRIETIKSNQKGLIHLDHLKQKISDRVAGLMLTNPNTLGIFEHQVKEMNQLLKKVDALFYLDGANMNALFGIVRPGDMGFDLMHLNLHKSFATPHGGGGPGAGPVAVNDKLAEFLPSPVIEYDGEKYYFDTEIQNSVGRVHSYYGNFAVLLRAYIYLRLLGAKGLRKVSEHAIINANYLYHKIKDLFVTDLNLSPMHEFVLSAEKQKEKGIKAYDIAKRILDFAIHPPTIYFPLIVKEALMIEPTETESKEMLDYYAEVMKGINQEINENSQLLKDAPHNTPVKKLDETIAAKNVNVNYYQYKEEC